MRMVGFVLVNRSGWVERVESNFERIMHTYFVIQCASNIVDHKHIFIGLVIEKLI